MGDSLYVCADADKIVIINSPSNAR